MDHPATPSSLRHMSLPAVQSFEIASSGKPKGKPKGEGVPRRLYAPPYELPTFCKHGAEINNLYGEWTLGSLHRPKRMVPLTTNGLELCAQTL